MLCVCEFIFLCLSFINAFVNIRRFCLHLPSSPLAKILSNAGFIIETYWIGLIDRFSRNMGLLKLLSISVDRFFAKRRKIPAEKIGVNSMWMC